MHETPISVVGLDHIQLAMPLGAESAARAVYAGFNGSPRS